MLNKQPSYWGNVKQAVRTIWAGLLITFVHILKARKSQKPKNIKQANYFSDQEGIATIQYPHVSLPIPDNGRYKLHNEIDDCIVCDKCVKVCPVNCITIEPIKATEEIGRTSDGTPKRIYAAKFDIDMAKCCFCGLCTTVCPTECLTMTQTFDFSVADIRDHNVPFAVMSAEEIAEKKQILAEFQKAKAATTQASEAAPTQSAATEGPKPSRPVFKPKIKPSGT